MAASELVEFAERLLALLEQTSYTTTYKYAVLLVLIDLCVQGKHRHSVPPDSVTTRQLAEKVIELYWPQTRLFGRARLRQIKSAGQAEIITLICEYRRELSLHSFTPPAARRGRRFQKLVKDVELVLIQMPLPRLQKVNGQRERVLYEIGWTENDAPSKREFLAHYAETPAGFFNNVHLLPGVGDHLATLNGLLRPLIHRAWSRMVAEFNGLQDSKLEAFLFGVDRTTLGAVRSPLLDLQAGRCFYCQGTVGREAQVDHFIPWARYPDNGIENLVVADENCNRHKRDFLAAGVHLARWRERNSEASRTLVQIAEHLRWGSHADETLGVARGLYFRLPARARLWVRKQEFVVADPSTLHEALA